MNKKKIREIIKIVNIIANIFRNISKLENQNDSNDRNLIITMKNHNEIVNILKRHLESNVLNEKIILIFQREKAILNEKNNHVCFN